MRIFFIYLFLVFRNRSKCFFENLYCWLMCLRKKKSKKSYFSRLKWFNHDSIKCCWFKRLNEADLNCKTDQIHDANKTSRNDACYQAIKQTSCLICMRVCLLMLQIRCKQAIDVWQWLQTIDRDKIIERAETAKKHHRKMAER